MFSLLKNKTENLKKANSLKITLINSLHVNIINIFVENKFSKINLVRRVVMFSVFCKPPMSNRRQLDSLVCFCIQSVTISHIVQPLEKFTVYL